MGVDLRVVIRRGASLRGERLGSAAAGATHLAGRGRLCVEWSGCRVTGGGTTIRLSRREFLRAGILGATAITGGTASDRVEAAVSMPRPAGAKEGMAPMRGPLFNQDSTEFFYTHGPDEMSGEAVDAWVDGLAEAGVGTLFSNVNAMKTNYASKVWEPDWHGYDPAAGDDQPVLRHDVEGGAAGTRRAAKRSSRVWRMAERHAEQRREPIE